MRAHPDVPEAVRLADERHDELVRGGVVELARAGDLLDATLVHHDDAVGDLHRLFLVVRHEHRRGVRLLVQPPQPDAQLRAHARVERAERLVQEQHLRFRSERARERHALALPARELRGVAVPEALQLHEVEQVVDARPQLRLGPLPDRQPERDVVTHRHVLEGRVVLEHEPDAALLRGERRRVLAGEPDRARVGRLEPRDDAQQGGLAGARRAEQRGQGAAVDVERHVVERLKVAEALRHVPYLDHFRSSAGGAGAFAT